MKYKFALLFNVILTFTSLSQIEFEKGYFINNDDQLTECLIKNFGWKNNPTKIEFKLDNNSKSDTASIRTTKEFGIYNVLKYIRIKVEIDRSSSNESKLSKIRAPIFKKEKLYLKVLIEGKANLYLYRNGSVTRYFYKIQDSKIEQLVYKKYKTNNNTIQQNNQFRQQLLKHMQCSSIDIESTLKLKYTKDELADYFTIYNECTNTSYISYISDKKKDLFNLSFRPRINNSSLKNVYAGYIADIDVGTILNFGFGIDAEYILPYYKNKWAISIEPTYQRYVAENTTQVDYVLGGEIVTNVEYNSIEIPFSIRYYMFLNDDSKLFVNTSYITDFSFDSFVDFNGANSIDINYYNVRTRWNWAFGIGYKIYDRFGIEMRYQTSRELLVNYHDSSSRYNVISMIFGYSVF